MKYCKKCILPDTRPNIEINKKGLCNSKCSTDKKISWKKREAEFRILANKIKKTNKSNYDCVVPVSGGKDSTWQILTALKYGLKPLAITWKTPQRSILGQKNLENLISLGVDHIDFTINPSIEKRLIYKSFILEGSPALTMHMAIHNIPKIFAQKLNIPIILWGENSAYEYGSEDKNLKGSRLTHNWRKKFGNLPKNFKKISKGIKRSHLSPYISHLNKPEKKLKEIFLGHYFYWDPIKIGHIVKKKGFKFDTKPIVGLYKFADIDDKSIITVHHWMKWYKFGFTRLWDNLSIEIREGRMTRQEAIKVVKKEKKIPLVQIKMFCKYLNISQKKFFIISEKFRNHKIWKLNNKNRWHIKNFLIKDYKW
jgi:N-acetyl sugar amidotransferase